MAGLYPDEEDQFGVLPPHFKEGVENKFIEEAMNLCFGSIIRAWSGKCAINSALLLFLASMVYHSSYLLDAITADSSHPFQTIPILHRPELLEKLRRLVTLEPAGKMKKPTGVPF